MWVLLWFAKRCFNRCCMFHVLYYVGLYQVRWARRNRVERPARPTTLLRPKPCSNRNRLNSMGLFRSWSLIFSALWSTSAGFSQSCESVSLSLSACVWCLMGRFAAQILLESEVLAEISRLVHIVSCMPHGQWKIYMQR